MERKAVMTFLQYGIPSNMAEKFNALGLTVSSFRTISQNVLIDKFGLLEEEIAFTRNCIRREPIDEDLIQFLLESSNFTCCLCKGTKSDGYIIHHINEYSKSQDNTFDNLAVLCPNDHDLAHREGIALTQRVTPDQIKKAKANWIKQVENENVRKASLKGDLHEVDYLNIPRILELSHSLFGRIPETSLSARLMAAGQLAPDNQVSAKFLREKNIDLHLPLAFFSGYGALELRAHFFELFLLCVAKLDFVDLDGILNKQVIQSGSIIGQHCFYVGGLYGNSPPIPIPHDAQPTHLYLRRRSFFVEWLLDPRYLTSVTAAVRLSDRTVYIVYGIVRNIGTKRIKEKDFVKIDIRPYAFGLPNVRKNRRPYVSPDFRDDEDDLEDELDS